MKGKKYLKKIQKKEMTINQVAKELNVSKTTVKNAYKEYRNPFKKREWELPYTIISICISIVAVIVSVFGLIIAFNANQEMELERKLEHSPVVKLNSDTIKLAWDENGFCHSISYSTNVNCVPVIDILPDLTAIRCMGLGDTEKIKIFDFKNIEDVRNYFINQIDVYKNIVTQLDKCKRCYYNQVKKCSGGCLAYKIDAIKKVKEKM